MCDLFWKFRLNGLNSDNFWANGLNTPGLKKKLALKKKKKKKRPGQWFILVFIGFFKKKPAFIIIISSRILQLYFRLFNSINISLEPIIMPKIIF